MTMTIQASPEQVATHVLMMRRRYPDAKVFALEYPGPWSGEERLEVEAEPFQVVFCPSPLAVSVALASRPDDQLLLILTPLQEADLTQDVLLRFAGCRLSRLNAWELLKERFRAHSLDSRLYNSRWMADALLRLSAGSDPEPVRSGVLDLDTAWTQIVSHELGLAEGRPDAQALIAWSLQPAAVQRLAGLDATLREALRERFAETAGKLGSAIWNAVEAGYGAQILAIGLVCEVLYVPDPPVGLIQAQARLEPMVGGDALSSALAAGWAKAAGAVLSRLPELAKRQQLLQAEELLADLKAAEYAAASRWLPRGFAQRCALFGKALAAYVSKAGELAELERAYSRVHEHAEASRHPLRLERLTMALRLARYLKVKESGIGMQGEQKESLSERAREYRSEGAYVDWARSALRGGDEDPGVSAALAELLARVRRLRETENQIFAERLADWSTAGSEVEGLLPIERVLECVVVPAAKLEPVLLVVLDGMSLAVYRELSESLREAGWLELAEEAGKPLPLVLSVLPSVTEFSRASLLTGSLVEGNADAERRGFAAHPGLLAASGGAAPILFHKAGVSDDAGLSEDLRQALRNRKQRVIGVVLNAVDDYLAKSEQIRLQWNLATVRYLDAMLAEARQARRLVIITSDHGHVLEDATASIAGGPAERWRQPGGTNDAREIAFSGPRIPASLGMTSVVVPWSETVRYTRAKNGYHGGATPQETLVPIALLAHAERFAGTSDPLEGWGPAAGETPEWWFEAPAQTSAVPIEPPAAPRGRQAARKVEPGFGPLFQAVEPPAEAPSWIDALLASETYQMQRRLVGRAALDDERVRKVLELLELRQHHASLRLVAQALGVPEFRMRGFVQVLQRMLNLEGYPAVSVDEATGSLSLDLALLRRQFAI